MSSQALSRIVEAMIELKERRDAGELVHEILLEVAEDHDVPFIELKSRAEVSWGSPLETDRERHKNHFDQIESATDIARFAREIVREIYKSNVPGLKKFRWWEISWAAELKRALEIAKFDDPALEKIFETEFIEESGCLRKAVELMKVSHA